MITPKKLKKAKQHVQTVWSMHPTWGARIKGKGHWPRTRLWALARGNSHDMAALRDILWSEIVTVNVRRPVEFVPAALAEHVMYILGEGER